MTRRQRLHVTGVVQGVGFRPFVYGLAQAHGLAGFVGNNSAGVFIEVEGPESALSAFQSDLIRRKPPLAHIEAIAVEELAPLGESGFRIVASEVQPAANTLISPDICLCADCRRELFDPNDRRYRYPFINCTNCGPRFTIIKDIPYDRPLTTMADFEMCPACQAEYHDPLDRRFHAQPNACPECGPHVWLEFGERRPEIAAAISNLQSPIAESPSPIAQARHLLSLGYIVAVKGIGGFHLACDATSDSALQTLRNRKGRVDKPFAIMVADLEAARTLAEVSEAEAALLTSRERPIVLLRRRPGAAVSALVAPGNPYLGVMLPYTPLHELLLEGRGPLVMTSANYSDEPIVKDNDEARERLAELADAFLMHNRDIHVHCDDSVMRVFNLQSSNLQSPVSNHSKLEIGDHLPLRRSRGYAPFPVKLPFSVRPTLAVGGELKATFCLARDDYAFMSQHIGDMENLETLQAFERAVEHFQTIFRCTPEIIVSDLHPRYLSTRWAHEHAGNRRHIRVQHHHAHIAAVMAENGYTGGRVIGFSFDGTGYGTDGAIWGGEVLLADYAGFERALHLAYVPLPGGDAAVKRPYRAALAHLHAAGVAWDDDLPPVAACPPAERNVLAHQIRTGLNAVPTSSLGRLFDAVAALCGIRQTVTYEAQAAIEMEALAADSLADVTAGAYPFKVRETVFDAAPVIRAMVADLRSGVAAPVIAAKFHRSVAELILTLSRRLRAEHGLNTVALSGGVFQNVTLLAHTLRLLSAEGFDVLTHRLVPPNDGGLALGQAVIGAKRILD
ncbi:MAG: carbamoyltransferase HypF [Anaerolineales bacterium]|nr:carbamoyltransferase HypF [Anaerolineales bacterium]